MGRRPRRSASSVATSWCSGPWSAPACTATTPHPVRSSAPPMRSALIGHTGFVGGNLLSQSRFDDLYNSTNIETIAGRQYDLVVCAGAPAEKWKANADPEGDRERLRRLSVPLSAARIDELILISTVDVYPVPRDATEDTPIDPAAGGAYGRNRLELERECTATFPTRVVRLPGLFGRGLKKNIIFDLLHDNRVDQIHADSVFQFYSLDRLWEDVETARRNDLRLVNFMTEPVSVREVAREGFGMAFDNTPPTAPAR